MLPQPPSGCCVVSATKLLLFKSSSFLHPLLDSNRSQVVPTEGDLNNTSPLERFPSADVTLLNFVRRNGCGEALSDGAWTSFRLDAPNRGTYDTPGSPFNYRGYYQVRDYSFAARCANRVEGWRIEGGNHFIDQGASKALFRKALEEFLLPLGPMP